MQKDTQQELARLERELLAEEEEPVRRTAAPKKDRKMFDQDAPTLVFRGSKDPFIEQIDAMIQPQMKTPPQNTDRTDCDLNAYSDEVWESEHPRKSLKGLVFLLICLTLGVVAVVAWWIFRILGGRV